MKNKKRNMKRSVLVILVSVLCVFLLTACSSEKKLSSDFDQAKVEEAGKKVIDLVNAQDNQALRDMSVEELKLTLTDQAMQPVHGRITMVGDFKGIENMEVLGHISEDGTEYAVFVARAEYGDKKQAVVYTITFTKDMELAGILAN